MPWGSQAPRKCILGWVSDLQSFRNIQDKLKKLSKNQVGGGTKLSSLPPPNWMCVKDKKFTACLRRSLVLVLRAQAFVSKNNKCLCSLCSKAVLDKNSKNYLLATELDLATDAPPSDAIFLNKWTFSGEQRCFVLRTNKKTSKWSYR